jgi:general secretion pathway protein E/type IV pilus assembly protein PilB
MERRDQATASGAIRAYEPLPAGADQFTLEFSEENRVVKLRETDDELTVGSCAGVDVASLLAHYRKRVAVVPMDEAEFASALGKLHGSAAEALGYLGGEAEERLTLDKVANDAPVVNYVNSVMIDAIQADASDIHFECYDESALVRFRVDGILATIDRFPKERFAAIATRLKVMANLNIMEKRLPQDGRITVDLGEDSVDIRASFVPIARGESIVLRLFSKSSKPLEIGELGFGEAERATVDRLLRHPHGLILVTGPTGSGKTTSLSAMLRQVRSDTMKIITIEDPIEYLIDGVNQIQTNESIGLTFDSILRRVLRQDPNVIMVGEVRDAATAELVVRAALTGHLVLSTLHTNDAASAIARLMDIGVEPYLIAGVLRGVVAQRLVRGVCPHCARVEAATPAERAIGSAYGVTLKKVPRAQGCDKCRGTGYSGRQAVFELFTVDDGLSELIARGERTSAIREYLTWAGVRSMAQAGLDAVARGETTVDELEREVDL